MKARFVKNLFSLMLPGGLLLALMAGLLKTQALPYSIRPLLPYLPYAVFVIGLMLSIAFHRSRIFFALLIVALAHQTLTWIVPRIAAAGVEQIVLDAVAILLPINLLALIFARDRGVVTFRGRWRFGFIALQVAAVALICLPRQARAAELLRHNFVGPQFSDWSRVSQPALLVFGLTGLLLLTRLLMRRRPMESGIFWALVASFIALNAGGRGALSSTYFATGGVILMISVLETSYRMAYRDELTELPSRRAFNEAVLKLGDSYAIGMVDVDHFKQFNDTYGHAAGDQVLRKVALELTGVTGGGRAFRYGGEEFAVVFPELSVEQAFTSLQSLRQKIEHASFKVRGNDRRKRSIGGRKGSRKRGGPAKLTVSIGVAEASANSKNFSPEDVVRAADKALYSAKKHGRNCVMVS